MARTVGVTVSALVVFIGSAFTILCGALLMLGLLATLHSREGRVAALNIPLVLAVEAGVFGFIDDAHATAAKFFDHTIVGYRLANE